MTEPSIFDLVRHNGRDLVAVSIPRDGLIMLTESGWPDEFAELDDHGIPPLIAVRVNTVEVIETAQVRFDDFNAKLTEAGSSADAREGWDWDDVNDLLRSASAILPRSSLEFSTDNGEWSVGGAEDPDLEALVRPAARVLATHVHGLGNADVGELSVALEDARRLSTPAPRPS